MLPRCQQVGRDLSLDELRRHYNAVVLCYGAESDRKLGVPGEVRSPRPHGWHCCSFYFNALYSCPLTCLPSSALSPTPPFPAPTAVQDLKGVYSAREFVWWYNGHPAYADLPIDLSRIRRVAICGLGNVAVDCARVLLQVGGRAGRVGGAYPGGRGRHEIVCCCCCGGASLH